MGNVRIAYFIDHLKVGGAQRHLVEVLCHLDRRRFSPQVWTLKGEGELIPQIEQLGVPVRNFGLGNRLQELKSVSCFVRTSHQLRQEQVHIVHSYLSVANVVGTLTGFLARIPILLISKRSLDSYHKKTEAGGQWLINRLADRVVANAQAVKQFVMSTEGCPSGKIVVIPNGISDDFVTRQANGCPADGRVTFGLTAEDQVVGTLGRLAWKKGHEYFLQTALIVVQQEPNACFVLVGDGPLRQQLEEQTRRLGIQSRVKFLGQRVDSQAMISLFDVFVLPSVIEGMSNALLEALALAKPTIVTDVGGNAEVVTHEQTGIVVPPKQPELMAEAILRVLRNKEWAQRLGEAGRQLVTHRFRLRQTVQAMETLYEELVGAKGLQL